MASRIVCALAPFDTSEEMRCTINSRPSVSTATWRLPDTYPEALLRTLLRRVRHWRGEAARGLVFGSPVGIANPDGAEAPAMAGAGMGVPG